MYIAHVDKADLSKKVISFHLNITEDERIPSPPFQVLASADNGRTGVVCTATQITEICHVPAGSGIDAFNSVYYEAKPNK